MDNKIETPLNCKWEIDSYLFKGDPETDYTEFGISYGINKYQDGPKGEVCKVRIPSYIPVEMRKKIMKIIEAANNNNLEVTG